MINIKLKSEAHDNTRPEVRAQLETLAARPDCLSVACSPPAAKGNEIADACISIIEAALGHDASFWIENPASELNTSMWEYPPMRTFIRNVGASIISIHQCMLGGPDAADTTGGMQTTKLVCDARLAPHLHRQLDVLKCDGSHPHDDTLQPKRGNGKCSADAATYPPELNRRFAVATTNAVAARHVASAALDFGSLAMSDAAVIKLSDGLAAARQITGATGLLSTCITSYINSASVIDRHKDVNLDSADYHNCPIDTPVAGGGFGFSRSANDRRSSRVFARSPASSSTPRSRSSMPSLPSRADATSRSRTPTSPTLATTTSSPSWRPRRATTRPTRR